MDDFNMTPENHHLKDFTNSNNFEIVIKEPTCFKSTMNLSKEIDILNQNLFVAKRKAYGLDLNAASLIHKCQCCPHPETSQLICTANQLTGFYMRVTLTLNGLIKLSHR